MNLTSLTRRYFLLLLLPRDAREALAGSRRRREETRSESREAVARCPDTPRESKRVLGSNPLPSASPEERESMTPDEKRARRIRTAPHLYRGILRRAIEGTASPRTAVKTMCL